MYAQYKTELEVYQLVKKYDEKSWQAKIIQSEMRSCISNINYFTYQEKYIGEKEIEGDLLMYDAYIEKEDLFGKTGEMKVIYTPRVSSAGNIGLRQYAMRGVRTRHSANALLSFGRWSSSARGRHHERPDRDGRHGPPSGDRLAWRSLGRGPRLRAMTHTRKTCPLGHHDEIRPGKTMASSSRQYPNTESPEHGR